MFNFLGFFSLSQNHPQISHELDNFITLQQQMQHPQTLTIHRLSRSLTSPNQSTPTPSSTYPSSQSSTLPKGIYNVCAKHKQVKKTGKRSTHTFCRIFWNIFNINQ